MEKITFICLLILISFASCYYEVDILQKLMSERPNDNIIYSPLSLFQAVSLVSNGAKDETKYQFLEVINQTNPYSANQKNYEDIELISQSKGITIANAILTKFTPNPNFINKGKQYQAYIDVLQNADQVNNWCAKKTNNKITKIVDSISDDIKMIILNAVYFKGEWKKQFDPKDTKPGVFHSPKGDQNIPMMTMTFYANYYETGRVKMIELPYVEKDLSALIILPTSDVDQYIKELNEKKIDISLLKLELKKVKFSMPKVELHYESSLKNAFQKLGATHPFDPEKADYSNITEHMKLFISDIIHKAYLKFDETGTEAAAVTKIEIAATSMIPNEKIAEMVVDRPFIIVIQHEKIKLPNLFFAKIASMY